MKILAIDSSSDVLSICINEGNNLIGEFTIKNKLTHSDKIVPMIDSLLKNLDITINDINLLACSIGPGSFTGLRIGLAVIKGIAQANNTKIVGIPTLLGLAKNVSNFSSYICPIIDAKNDNIYTCIFDKNYSHVLDYTSMNIDELIDFCKQLNSNIYFVGNGAIIHKEKILKELSNIEFIDSSNYILSARSIANCAYARYLNNDFDNLLALSPTYLKSSSAERLKDNG